MKLLHIDSSPLAANSASRDLTHRTVAQWRAAHPVDDRKNVTGDPNHKGLPRWPAVTTAKAPSMLFDTTCKVAEVDV